MLRANYPLAGFLTIYFLQVIFDLWLDRLNIRHARACGNRVPRPFENFVDASRLSRISDYTIEKSNLGLVQGLFSEAVLLMLLLSFMPFLDRALTDHHFSPIPGGLVFFLIPGVILYCLELPFAYYHSFVIEAKYGFNRSTLKIWITDHVKSGVLSLVLFGIILSLILWMIRLSPERWWLFAFLIVSSVQVLIAVIYPVFIAPLFNKFEPVQDELLARRINRLMEENGIRVKKILQMNAGIRSRHTNAYFTGIGRTKQIVLYDTLLESHPHDEILAVLAHEVGHFKKKHILKQLVLFEASMLAIFYLIYRLMGWPLLYTTFGFEVPQPHAGLFLIGIFLQKAGFFAQPFYLAVSRRFERQSDLFAARLLKSAKPMITAFKRMAADNLSNLTPHPLYVRFHYSHPPLIERIMTLEGIDPQARHADEASGTNRPERRNNPGSPDGLYRP